MTKPGTKFKALEKKLSKNKAIYDPEGLAAAIGRKNIGEKKMEKLSLAGKKKHTKSK